MSVDWRTGPQGNGIGLSHKLYIRASQWDSSQFPTCLWGQGHKELVMTAHSETQMFKQKAGVFGFGWSSLFLNPSSLSLRSCLHLGGSRSSPGNKKKIEKKWSFIRSFQLISVYKTKLFGSQNTEELRYIFPLESNPVVCIFKNRFI